MSSRQTTRERLTHFVIALSVVAGGYLFLVEPQKRLFDELEAQVQELRTQASETTDEQAGPNLEISDRVAQLRRLVHEIERGNEPYLDATRLYEDITSLADARGIELGPFSPKHREASQQEPAALSLRLIASGAYEELTDFVSALEFQAGFSRIVEIGVRPTGDRADPTVRATIQVEFLKFELPEALASLVEGQDAKH
jgi:Tfp pilus assembly protein PilO